jgi:cobyrinic acid a,c-diamide synthase
MPFLRRRIIITALRGGAGKTILTLGLVSALREKGYRIAPFKKGPDFIDAGWLAFAADRSCYNLDPFLMTEEQILKSFFSHSEQADLSIIEGNRGLYDGFDLDGRSSTAELAKLIKTPVIVIADVTMATRTIAAIVKGCQTFDPELNIGGIILNRVAGPRQENLIREAIKKYCGIPVVGAIPKLEDGIFPERHMGLVPHQEREHAEKAILWAKKAVENNLQLDVILKIAGNVERFDEGAQEWGQKSKVVMGHESPRIGFIRDRAFWFYYPENLRQLERMGAVLVEIDAISSDALPHLDALYIGGGFPETQARSLADNQAFRNALREEIERGLPVYAECGGFMYLGESLVLNDKTYPMVGSLPVKFILQKRPQGHGYTILKVNGPNPYYPQGETLKGHEFHYSKAVLTSEKNIRFAFKVNRGCGVDGQRDGVCKKNLLATYTHVHAAGNPLWAVGFIRKAIEFMKKR